MKILANDGISQGGIEALQKNGFEVITTKVAQAQLENFINKHKIDVILVRSSTQVKQELIAACPSIKLIGRGGVGMDNIDVDYAINKGLKVINTPEASSISVAELVFAHLFGMVRFLHQSNREMPLEGDSRFKELKKSFSKGSELKGKKMGIIGFGRIGQEVAKIALGVGMELLVNDRSTKSTPITIDFFNGKSITFPIEKVNLESLLKESDFISLHIPAQKNYVIGEKELKKMKTGVCIVNASRGGVIDEMALVDAIKNEKVKFAGLDVFEKEPTPEIQLLMNPELSLTPHIGAGTVEAQDRIGLELATQIIKLLKA